MIGTWQGKKKIVDVARVFVVSGYKNENDNVVCAYNNK